MPDVDLRLGPITAEQTRPLRHAVLRPHQTYDQTRYPLDEHPLSWHVGAWRAGRIVGIASLFPQAEDGGIETGAWRLRGMAVEPPLRGAGIGRALLAATIEHARSQSGREVWCNARVSASGFYLSSGFTVRGDEFELPGIGPHLVMFVKL